MATLNPKLKDFWIGSDGKLLKARNRVLHGGRSSSKSWEYAGRVSQITQEYKTRVLCVRRYQNKIKDSVYTLIKNQIDNFKFNGFDIQANCINHENGSEMVFYGIERNIDEIKSFEGCDILWIEEAHNLTKEQWEILEPTIRKQGSEIWISFNGKFVPDFIWQYFIVNTPEDTIVRQINYDENEFVSDTILKVINSLKVNDYETYKHVYLGVPLSNDDSVIIRREWIEAAIDFHIEFEFDCDETMTGRSTLGYDVADSGDDKNAVTHVDGRIIDDSYEWSGGKNELTKSAKRVKTEAVKHDATIIYDSIGVGAHTGSTLKDNNFYSFRPFNAGGKVYKPMRKYKGIKQGEFFSNIKAQAWWIVADMFRNTHDYVVNGNHNYTVNDLVSINGKMRRLQQLMSELSTPRQDFDKQGRVKVESKDDLKARGIKSPNLADSCIMALIIELVANLQVSTLDIRGI